MYLYGKLQLLHIFKYSFGIIQHFFPLHLWTDFVWFCLRCRLSNISWQWITNEISKVWIFLCSNEYCNGKYIKAWKVYQIMNKSSTGSALNTFSHQYRLAKFNKKCLHINDSVCQRFSTVCDVVPGSFPAGINLGNELS